MHLLLVEDDLDLGAAMQRALKSYGYTSVWIRSIKDALAHTADYSEHTFACVLLDLGLPDGDGFSLLKSWRKRGFETPIIVLTAQDALKSKIHGLDIGADDYLVKPITPEELSSRIRAVTRRVGGRAADDWSVGRLRIVMASREVYLDGTEIALSPKEFLVLLELARTPGAVVPKHRVAKAISPLNESIEFNALEVHIHNLRRKLGFDLIRTVRGVGYGVEL